VLGEIHNQESVSPMLREVLVVAVVAEMVAVVAVGTSVVPLEQMVALILAGLAEVLIT
jgi:hypothetical protein